jgi:antitoxin MazE
MYIQRIYDHEEGVFMITRFQKWGNSQGIRIPKHILNQASFSEEDEVEIVVEDKSIVIRHVISPLKKYDLKELFDGYNGDYRPGEDWGSPQGREEL